MNLLSPKRTARQIQTQVEKYRMHGGPLSFDFTSHSSFMPKGDSARCSSCQAHANQQTRIGLRLFRCHRMEIGVQPHAVIQPGHTPT